MNVKNECDCNLQYCIVIMSLFTKMACAGDCEGTLRNVMIEVLRVLFIFAYGFTLYNTSSNKCNGVGEYLVLAIMLGKEVA